jgi:hypothetical protein
VGILSRIQAGLEYDAYVREIMDPPLHGTGR